MHRICKLFWISINEVLRYRVFLSQQKTKSRWKLKICIGLFGKWIFYVNKYLFGFFVFVSDFINRKIIDDK